MASGRLFQVCGPAMANDLSPNEVCVCGTSSFALSGSADLIPGRRSTLGWQNSAGRGKGTSLFGICISSCCVGRVCRWTDRAQYLMWPSSGLCGWSHTTKRTRSILFVTPYSRTRRISQWMLKFLGLGLIPSGERITRCFGSTPEHYLLACLLLSVDERRRRCTS